MSIENKIPKCHVCLQSPKTEVQKYSVVFSNKNCSVWNEIVRMTDQSNSYLYSFQSQSQAIFNNDLIQIFHFQ